MILQVSDFTGAYRLPAGVAQVDIQAALRQADDALLREYFDAESVALIEADPLQPPATTLRSGAGGIGIPWIYVALPYASAAIRWDIIGQGAPVLADTSAVVGHAGQLLGRLEGYGFALRKASRHWEANGQVTAVTATDFTLSIPALTAQWCRAGMEVKVGGEVVQVVSVSTTNITLTLPSFPAAVGSVLKLILPLKLRQKLDKWGVWTK